MENKIDRLIDKNDKFRNILENKSTLQINKYASHNEKIINKKL